MNIILFYQYFCTSNGSWSTRIYEFARRWVDAGHNVTVITGPYEKSDIRAKGLISTQHIAGIKVIVINSKDSNRFSLFKRKTNSIAFAFISSYFALVFKYDVLISSSGPLSIGFPMILAKVLRSKITVFEVRDLWPAGAISLGKIKREWQKKWAWWFEKKCYQNANAIVTASPDQKINIKDRFPSLKVFEIPHGSDLYLFGSKATGTLPAWTTGKVLFTHIGSLGFIHNVNYWLEVAGELLQIDLKTQVAFVFIGEGSEKNELEGKARDLGLNNVHFLGLMPKYQLPLWVQASRATLVATLDDPIQNSCCPNKLFDSFAAGVPVVQTTTGWIGELIEKHDCGVNVSLSDPEAAAKELFHLVENENVSHRKGANARRLAETIFNRDKLSDEYLSILESISASHTAI